MRAKPFLQFQIHVDMPQKSLIFKAILTDCGAADRLALLDGCKRRLEQHSACGYLRPMP